MKKLKYLLLCTFLLFVSFTTGYLSVDYTLDFLIYQFSKPGSSSGAGIQNGQWRTFMDLGRPNLPIVVKALVAKIGIGALTSEEALYWTTFSDNQNKALDSHASYEVIIPSESLHEKDGFWSLSLYNKEGYFIKNSADINSLGSRDNLTKNPDGTISIIISHNRPEGIHNWLPAPYDQVFNLTFRVYLPNEKMLTTPEKIELPIVKKWEGA